MLEFLKMSTTEKNDTYRIVSEEKKINEAIIEKDYWVVLMLYLLFTESKFKKFFAFKGGTSLSKSYHKIQRFSEDIDLAIVKGNFAVAENGAIWMKDESNRHRSLYFIAQNIVIVINENEIVNNMHEAYEKLSFEKAGFGVFISGPSKTADIEQSLVIGAHGPKSGYVIFIKS